MNSPQDFLLEKRKILSEITRSVVYIFDDILLLPKETFWISGIVANVVCIIRFGRKYVKMFRQKI